MSPALPSTHTSYSKVTSSHGHPFLGYSTGLLSYFPQRLRSRGKLLRGGASHRLHQFPSSQILPISHTQSCESCTQYLHSSAGTAGFCLAPLLWHLTSVWHLSMLPFQAVPESPRSHCFLNTFVNPQQPPLTHLHDRAAQ